MGGFGNVLFQILAYNIVLNKSKKKVFYVTKLTEKNSITKTIKWSIHQNLYNDLINENQKFKVSTCYSICAVLLGFLSKSTGFFFNFSTFYTNKKLFDSSKLPANIFGYFQEKEFLTSYQSELLALGEIIRNKYILERSYDIVVHYRRGDSGWAIMHSGYYESIKKLLKKEDKDIYIVTDSYKDADIFFAGVENVKIINSENAIDDFKIMVSAKKLYCAPSTFSWWAAHALDEESNVIIPSFLENDLGVYVKGSYQII